MFFGPQQVTFEKRFDLVLKLCKKFNQKSGYITHILNLIFAHCQNMKKLKDFKDFQRFGQKFSFFKP